MGDNEEFKKEIERAKQISDLRSSGKIVEAIGQLEPHEAKLFELKLKLAELQLKDFEDREKVRRSDFTRLLLSTSLGIILGGIISYWLLKVEKPTQVFPIIHQKNQVFHDTIYIAMPNTSKDTSLVRLVKTKTKK